MNENMIKYMNIALKEARKAYKKNEIPVGAIIVRNNKIISKACNKKEKTKIVSNHAEIIAINKACKKLKNWRLNDCEIYITMEPCMMCCGAILQSRISKIIYGTTNDNNGYLKNIDTQNVKVIGGICEEECKRIVKKFFVKKRP